MYIQHVSVPRPPGKESRETAVTFYSDLLGMTKKPEPQSIQHLDLVWFQVGDLELHCFAEEPVGDTSGRHFCLAVEDVEAMRQKLIAASYEPWNPEEIPGRPRFFCRDPFDNIIEFTSVIANYQELESRMD